MSKNNTKTGLQAWAEANNTTDKEMLMLLRAEGHDPEQFLGAAVKSDAPLPNGRGEALKMLLTRGRTVGIDIPRDVVEDVLGVSVANTVMGSQELWKFVARVLCEAVEDGENSGISEMPDSDNSNDNNGNDAPGNTDPAAKAPSSGVVPAAKPVARKKTKYSISKATFENTSFTDDIELGSLSGTLRQFLLSTGHKAQDVALMTDYDIYALFDEHYFIARFGSGTLVLDKQGYEKFRELLVSEGYYIPQPASEGDK